MIIFYRINGTGMGFAKSPAGFDVTIPLAVLANILLVVCLRAAPSPLRPRSRRRPGVSLDAFEKSAMATMDARSVAGS
jgi:hypothetical protein